MADDAEGFSPNANSTAEVATAPGVPVNALLDRPSQMPCEDDDSHVFWYYYKCEDWAVDMTGTGVTEDRLRDPLVFPNGRTAEIEVHAVT